MFSWIRGRKQEDKVFPSGVVPVDPNMQKKYAKGVQYNMKIILKGDRNTGKSMLLTRLSGGDFKEHYIPTHEIQVANVNWNYRGAGDVVKVEVWDIVDKSQKKRHPSDTLKLTNDENVQLDDPTEGMTLDAELVNVYKGTHGVILMVDITKVWTWQYAQRELHHVPAHIPVLVLANFRDMGEHRVVHTEEIVAFIEHYERPSGSAEIYFSECSLKDGYGLRFIYQFLNMPFLILQRETLLRQLEANALEIEETRELLFVTTSSHEQNYGMFKEMLLQKSNPDVNVTETSEESSVDPSIMSPEPKPLCPASTKQLPIATVPPTVHDLPISATEAPKPSRFQTYKAKLFGSDASAAKDSTDGKDAVVSDTSNADTLDIHDFQPGALDNNFLSGNASKESVTEKKTRLLSENTSDDENPMVACDEDLEDDVKIFDKQQESADEFEDLSDDERPQLEENETSLLAQAKQKKAIDDAPIDVKELSLSDSKQYGDIDTVIPETTQPANRISSNDDEPCYDVVDTISEDWMKESEEDRCEVKEDKDISENAVCFDVDDLVLFMQNQMEKSELAPENTNTKKKKGKTSQSNETTEKPRHRKNKSKDGKKTSSVDREKKMNKTKKGSTHKSSQDALDAFSQSDETTEKPKRRKNKSKDGKEASSSVGTEKKLNKTKNVSRQKSTQDALDAFYS